MSKSKLDKNAFLARPSSRASMSPAQQKKLDAFIDAGEPTRERARASSRKKREEEGVRVVAHIPKPLQLALKLKAVQEDRSMTDIVIGALSQYLGVDAG